MSFWQELRRRNVVRVGIAYVVGAWLVLQLAEVLSELLSLPAQIGPIVVGIVVIGLPVVLLAAWAYELTPEGIKRESEVDRSQSVTPQTGRRLNSMIVLLLGAAVVYLLVDKFFGEQAADIVSTSEQAAPATEQERPSFDATGIDPNSIAVLPFDNRSQRQEDVFFVEGIHDDLLTNLARIGDLKVISRTSVMQFQDTAEPIPAIAQQLEVATIMEGAVQRSGDTVRINVQLIDAATDRHLWAETYDRQLTAENLFDIQTEISEQIATELQATLSPAEQERIENRPTNDLAAYSAYLRGRQALERRSAEGAETALVEFQRAVDLDPNFAAAWAGVAMAANLDFDVSDMNLEEARTLAGEAVAKALALDDQLGEVYLAKAQYHDLNWDEAEQEEAALKRAIELSPGDARAHLLLSNHYSQLANRGDEALTLAQEAARLDPLSDNVQIALVNALIALEQHQIAEERLLRLIEQNPEFPAYYARLSEVTERLGRLDEAMLWRRKAQALDPGNIRLVLEETWALTSLGMEQELDRLAERLQVLDPDSSTVAFSGMIVALYRRDFELGLAHTERYAELLPEQRGIAFTRFYMMSGQPESARAALEEALPVIQDPDGWKSMLPRFTSLGCWFAWVVAESGDEALGQRMATDVYAYFEREAPLGAGVWDLMSLATCDLVVDDHERALARLEQAVEIGAFSGWWQTIDHPVIAPIQEEPRFVSVSTTIREEMRRQRENLERVWAEEAP